MAPRTDLALFLDLETTGNGEEDEIIEVGCSLVETADWTEVGFYSHLVVPSPAAWDRMIANDVVHKMHESNGLIRDLMAVDVPGAYSAEAIDRDVEQWLDIFLKGETRHIPYGGSGVEHFDRPYIRRQMPRLNKRITFWAYDAGTHRRTFRLAGRPWLNGKTSADKTHRALADARFHAAEWRYAITAIRSGFDPKAMQEFATTMDF